nr:NADH dehydrogenase subunit 5 [Notomastus sp. GK-2021]
MMPVIRSTIILGGCALLIAPFTLSNVSAIVEWKMLSIMTTAISISWLIDSLAMIFSFSVLFIAACVFLFAQTYMKPDSHRFVQILFLFVLSMNILIYSSSLVGLLLGWDGLGLTSFLLVMYYQNPYAAGASLITALTNRLGDVALILLVTAGASLGHWQITSMSLCLPAAILLVFGAMTKSAQFPFCSWLPQAMAAPTPVSALVHSSTLVTAGVYLLIRFFPMLPSSILHLLTLAGASTMLLASVSACYEFDLKKVVAYSTLSQLGLMFVALGLGAPLLALFHLLTHAMFKAVLFLCVGICIHYHLHMQDIRFMGNLSHRLPVTHSIMLIANLALCGTPFLAGFYSKEPILELASVTSIGWLTLFFAIGATLLTTTYSIRNFSVTQTYPSLHSPLIRVNDENHLLLVPICLLGTGAILWGATLNWVLLPPIATPTTSLLSLLPLFLIFAGAGLASVMFLQSPILSSYLVEAPWQQAFNDTVSNLWFLTTFSSQQIIAPPLLLGQRLLSQVDQGWLEFSTQTPVTLLQKTMPHIHRLNNLPFTTVLMTGSLSMVMLSLFFL